MRNNRYIVAFLVAVFLFAGCSENKIPFPKRSKSIVSDSSRDTIISNLEEKSEYQQKKTDEYRQNENTVKFENKSNIPDQYNDRLDDYLDDPEDELEFPPEIYDFSDD